MFAFTNFAVACDDLTLASWLSTLARYFSLSSSTNNLPLSTQSPSFTCKLIIFALTSALILTFVLGWILPVALTF